MGQKIERESPAKKRRGIKSGRKIQRASAGIKANKRKSSTKRPAKRRMVLRINPTRREIRFTTSVSKSAWGSKPRLYLSESRQMGEKIVLAKRGREKK